MTSDPKLETALRSLVAPSEETDFIDFRTRFEARVQRRRLRLAAGALSLVAALGLLTVGAIRQLDQGSKVADAPKEKPPGTSLDAGVVAIDLAAADDRIYVMSISGQIRMLKVPSSRFPQPPVEKWPRFRGGHGIRASESALVVLGGDGLVLIDPTTGDVIKRVPGYARTVALPSRGRYLWRDNGDGSMSRIDTRDFSVSDPVSVIEDRGDYDSRPATDLATDYGAAWVGDGNTGMVARIDDESLDVQRISIGPPMEEAGRPQSYVQSVETGGGFVWACCDELGRIAAIDPETLTVQGRVDFGPQRPGGVSMSFGGGGLWFSTFHYADLLGRIDPEDFDLQGPFYPEVPVNEFASNASGLIFLTEQPGPGMLAISYDEASHLPTRRPESKTNTNPFVLIGILLLLGGLVFASAWLGRD